MLISQLHVAAHPISNINTVLFTNSQSQSENPLEDVKKPLLCSSGPTHCFSNVSVPHLSGSLKSVSTSCFLFVPLLRPAEKRPSGRTMESLIATSDSLVENTSCQPTTAARTVTFVARDVADKKKKLRCNLRGSGCEQTALEAQTSSSSLLRLSKVNAGY